ncbi:unnamed protein product [Bursaphelenchus xylophilus]|nr:unnamed protein product [Bursaphelenchus xylophilus]CAG9110099.1 unnamed protein product [Bursaphelenchus xylophilus]
MSEQPEKPNDGFLAPSLPAKRLPRSPSSESSGTSQSTKKARTNPESSTKSAKQVEYVDDFTPPSWAEVPPSSSDLSAEVMQNGVIKETVKLRELAGRKSYVTIGRAEICDIKVQVTEASRIHCYLQYGEAFDGRGWYVYDKGSTHGTFINKQELPKNVFYKAKPGSIIQIAKANFHLFLTGSDEKTEREAEVKKLVIKPPTEDETRSKRYDTDPLGVLKEFCDREGLDFEFEKIVGEKKEITCNFDLPDNVCGGEGGVFTAVSTNPQEAQKECARKVCAHLDTLGLIGGGITWQAKKHQQDNDFYDDDEDTFYDRTGQIEAQREKRIQRFKEEQGIKDKAMSYEEITEKLTQLKDTEKAISDQLERVLKPFSETIVNPDEVNVGSLKASLSIRMEVSRLKKKLEEARKEMKIMSKAEEVARPVSMKLKAPKPREVTEKIAAPQIEKQEDLPKMEVTEEKGPEMPPLDEIPPLDVKESTSKPVEEYLEVAKKSEPNVEAAETSKPEKSLQRVGADGKKYGLLSRTELRKQDEVAKTKRKAQEEFLDELESDEKRNKTEEEVEKDEEPVWAPPTGQTGDGRTALNDKLGY